MANRKLIYSPQHPKPNFHKKYCFEYVLIMENHIGRHLKKGEIIHHINGNEMDNKIENLQLMTQSKHAKIHKNTRGV